MTATCAVCSFRMRLSGAGEVVRPGEEVPHPDGREELPENQRHHVRGEQASHRGLKEKVSFPSKSPFNIDELFEQGLLHISEPDLVYVDGPPHSPCPSSASFSSSLLPSPELYPVRLQEVTLHLNPFFLTKSSSSSFITRYPL